jgi:hypothetical protein
VNDTNALVMSALGIQALRHYAQFCHRQSDGLSLYLTQPSHRLHSPDTAIHEK